MAAPQPTTMLIDVSRLPPSAGTIEVLARLELAARRSRCRLRFCAASDELRELVAFAGLDGVLRLEARRQAEEREDPLGVEEERQLDDPPV